MGKGIARTEYDGVCKCENPKLSIVGYSKSGLKRIPIYRCYNCLKQFKNSSKKWGNIYKEINNDNKR